MPLTHQQKLLYRALLTFFLPSDTIKPWFCWFFRTHPSSQGYLCFSDLTKLPCVAALRLLSSQGGFLLHLNQDNCSFLLISCFKTFQVDSLSLPLNYFFKHLDLPFIVPVDACRRHILPLVLFLLGGQVIIPAYKSKG